MDGKELAAYLAGKGFVVKSISTVDSLGNTLAKLTKKPELPKCPTLIRAPFTRGLTGVTLPKCIHCYKKFANEVALKNHLKNNHLEHTTLESLSTDNKYLCGNSGGNEILPHHNEDESNCVESEASIASEAQYFGDARKRSYESSLPIGSQYQIVDSSFIGKEAKRKSDDSDEISYIIIKTDPESDRTYSNAARRARRVETKPRKPYESKGQRETKKITELSGPFHCVQCEKVYDNCCDYSHHFHNEHSKRRKSIHRCQICEKRFDHELDPKLGVFIYPQGNNADDVHFCNICGKTFTESLQLEQHHRVHHAKRKPFQCNICRKNFAQPTGLNQHMRTHSGLKPFICNVCSKTFTQKAGLDQHMRIHSKVKPYACVMCGKSFTQSAHLSQHMRIHTKIEPFECGVCERRFKQSSHLNFHLKSHEKQTDVSDRSVFNMFVAHGQPMDEAVIQISQENFHIENQPIEESDEEISI